MPSSNSESFMIANILAPAKDSKTEHEKGRNFQNESRYLRLFPPTVVEFKGVLQCCDPESKLHNFCNHPSTAIAISEGAYLTSVTAKLCQEEEWQKLHSKGCEMTITKVGRRMYPPFRLTNIRGLEEKATYRLWLEFVQFGDDKYRYSYHGSTWVKAGAGERNRTRGARLYSHPDSPATGMHWMTQTASFEKMKMTNSRDKPGMVPLSSMQKYLPLVHFENVTSSCDAASSQRIAFLFPQTTFMAVTAYQNQDITQIKINHNPFAKGFRDKENSKKRLYSVRGPVSLQRRSSPVSASGSAYSSITPDFKPSIKRQRIAVNTSRSDVRTSISRTSRPVLNGLGHFLTAQYPWQPHSSLLPLVASPLLNSGCGTLGLWAHPFTNLSSVWSASRLPFSPAPCGSAAVSSARLSESVLAQDLDRIMPLPVEVYLTGRQSAVDPFLPPARPSSQEHGDDLSSIPFITKLSSPPTADVHSIRYPLGTPSYDRTTKYSNSFTYEKLAHSGECLLSLDVSTKGFLLDRDHTFLGKDHRTQNYSTPELPFRANHLATRKSSVCGKEGCNPSRKPEASSGGMPCLSGCSLCESSDTNHEGLHGCPGVLERFSMYKRAAQPWNEERQVCVPVLRSSATPSKPVQRAQNSFSTPRSPVQDDYDICHCSETQGEDSQSPVKSSCTPETPQGYQTDLKEEEYRLPQTPETHISGTHRLEPEFLGDGTISVTGLTKLSTPSALTAPQFQWPIQKDRTSYVETHWSEIPGESPGASHFLTANFSGPGVMCASGPEQCRSLPSWPIPHLGQYSPLESLSQMEKSVEASWRLPQPVEASEKRPQPSESSWKLPEPYRSQRGRLSRATTGEAEDSSTETRSSMKRPRRRSQKRSPRVNAQATEALDLSPHDRKG